MLWTLTLYLAPSTTIQPQSFDKPLMFFFTPPFSLFGNGIWFSHLSIVRNKGTSTLNNMDTIYVNAMGVIETL